MSEQEKETSIPGYVKPDTIWGFEEPENNLEFKYAFDVAEKIKEYSEDIQIFITTHSPAFYALDKEADDGVSIFYISQNDQNCTDLRKISHDHTDKIHEEMGMLPIITPYLEKIYESEKKLLEAVEKIKELEEDFSCFVLTEDEDYEALEKLLEFNGFNMDETKIVSYEGSGAATHAPIVLGKFIKSTNEDASIVVHRDRDYLTDQQINEIRDKIQAEDFYFFAADGTDVESCFIVKEHICELYGELSLDDVDQFISEATDGAREDSLKRLFNSSVNAYKTQDIHGRVRELEQAYEANKERYRYGKKVLGLLRSKIQRRLRRNPNFFQNSEHIKIEGLERISELIWQ